MFKVLGITLVVLALALAIVPHYTDCQSQGAMMTTSSGMKTPMKCHWSGIAEIGVAAPLVGVGAMLSFSRRKNYILGISAIGAILGAMAIALPAKLIGTCPTVTHICNTTMKPAYDFRWASDRRKCRRDDTELKS